MIDIGSASSGAHSDHIRLLKLPAQRTHVVHGVYHGIELLNLTVSIHQSVVPEELPFLSEIDGDGHLRAEELLSAKDFTVNLTLRRGGKGENEHRCDNDYNTFHGDLVLICLQRNESKLTDTVNH